MWTASDDATQPDFLAVLDVTEDGARYGRLVTTLPVPGRGNVPHHTEHEMPADGRLFANGFGSGQSFVFDLTNPAQPRIASQFGDLEGYSHPHSFLRLPNGNVLATFQMRHEASTVTAGGLVELTTAGVPVRSRSANYAGADPGLRVYSGAIVPTYDRIVTTTTDMDKDNDSTASRNLQVWRLSDLSLLRTFPLPDGAAGGEGLLTAEPRLLDDGKTVLVSTFNCGLYLMNGLEGDTPSARLVASFPRKAGTNCAIPVIAGRYYLVTVPAWSAVVSLDISDPGAPREVSRVTLGAERRAALDRDLTGPSARGRHRIPGHATPRGDRSLRPCHRPARARRALPRRGRHRAGFPHGQQDMAAWRHGQGHSTRRGVQPAVGRSLSLRLDDLRPRANDQRGAQR